MGRPYWRRVARLVSPEPRGTLAASAILSFGRPSLRLAGGLTILSTQSPFFDWEAMRMDTADPTPRPSRSRRKVPQPIANWQSLPKFLLCDQNATQEPRFLMEFVAGDDGEFFLMDPPTPELPTLKDAARAFFEDGTLTPRSDAP